MKIWRKLSLIGSVAAVFGLTACGNHAVGATTTIPANAQKVNVVASNFQWTLNKTTFAAGKPIEFVLSSTVNTHGFSIVGTNVSQTVNEGDKSLDVVWTPPKAGTYTIRCNVYCGSGHPNMFTTFVVQ